MSLLNSLKQPFPHNTGWQSGLKIAAGFGAFVALFLLLLKPFGLDGYSSMQLIRGSVVFGVVTFICIFVSNFLLHFFFPRLFGEQNWTTGKQILNIIGIIILIGLVNFMVAPMLFNTSFSWRALFHYQWIALVVGISPVIIYTLLVQNRLLSHYKHEAADLQKKLEEKKEREVKVTTITEPVNIEKKDSFHPAAANDDTVAVNGLISFESENQKEKKTIAAADLVYIESASNYIKIFFNQKEKLNYSIIRMTMKNAADSLASHEVFFRCHRAYIVNLDKIEKVEGNAQGYKLKLQGTEELIPVSRNLNSEFSDRLLEFRKAG